LQAANALAFFVPPSVMKEKNREYKRGKYHCTVDLLFDWFGIVCLQIKTKIVSCRTADSTPDKQQVNGTVILPPLVFPEKNYKIATLTILEPSHSGKGGSSRFFELPLMKNVYSAIRRQRNKTFLRSQ
jgi:hypothetical protein